MQQRNNFSWAAHFLLPAIILGSLVGCDRAEPTAYKIPKETREVSMPMAPAATGPAMASTGTPGMTVLPGMAEAADEAGTILYTTPEGWTDLPASGIRKAHLQVSDENGSADLTITTFPGDVGGNLANINRWRGQIQLDPITEADMANVAKPTAIFNHGALYVTLDGGVDSILAAILPFHGYTWFIKLQGSSATVFANESKFQDFLNSVEMEGHAH